MRAGLLAAVVPAMAACGGTAAPSGEGAAPTPPPGRRIAIYSQGGAIVVDRRWLEVPAGDSRLELGDLAASVVPATLTMRALGRPGDLEVGERSFDPGLARAPGAAEAILAESIGRPIEVERGGQRLRGRLAAVRGGEIVIEQGRTVRTVPWRDADGLAVGGRRRVGRPTLVARVAARRGGRHLIELVYSAEQLSFAASYAVAVRGATAEVRPSVQVDNASGLDLGGARLALYSGRLGASADEERPVVFWTGAAVLIAGSGHSENRLLSFAPARVPARIEIVYQGALPDAANPAREPVYGTGAQSTVHRHLLLEAGAGLPAVLPPGPALVDIAGAGGEELRLASRLADRVLAGGEVRLELDADRQLSGERRQVRVDRTPDGRLTEAYEITVRNGGSTAARVRVVEPLTRSSQVTVNRAEPSPTTRRDRKLEWLVEVPARGESKVSFEATYRF